MSKGSSKLSREVKEVIDWINNDPYKEALLIVEAPIGRTTLMQIKAGNYSPSVRMVKALLSVKTRFPLGLPEAGGKKSSAS